MQNLKVKEPPYFIFFLILATFVCLILIQPYLFEEILNSIFQGSDTIIVSSKILSRNSSFDIGILIIVDEKTDLNEYWQALASVKCYANIHGYGFQLIRINDYWRSQCHNQDINFLQFCITSKVLKFHEWTLFLSPDSGIVNPNRLIEEFIVDENADLIFYDKIQNWEISTDSFLTRNSTFVEQFLSKLAKLEFELPQQSFHGMDTVALHWLFLKEFYSNISTSNLSPSNCWTILSEAKTYDDLEIFKACSRQIFGERHQFCFGSNYCIYLLSKVQAWIRDGSITVSKWSLERDFMFNGWKESYRIPRIEEAGAWNRASKRLLYSSWYSPIAKMPFNDGTCKNGTISWEWHSSFLVPNSDLEILLEEVQNEAQANFFEAVSSISKYS